MCYVDTHQQQQNHKVYVHQEFNGNFNKNHQDTHFIQVQNYMHFVCFSDSTSTILFIYLFIEGL